MDFYKNFLKKIGLFGVFKWWLNLYLLFLNYFEDLVNYFKYSNIFKKNNFFKIESEIIMAYHSIEKGFLFDEIRPRFAKEKVELIIKNIDELLEKDNYVIKNQILVAVNILVKYYEYHELKKIDISDFFSLEKFNFFKIYSNFDFKPVHRISKSDFYKNTYSDFYNFSNSRKSIRNFNGEIISDEIIKEVIHLSNNAPSVCNRQSSKVYLINSEDKIKSILKIQGGFVGYEKTVKQLLILTSNKNYFYTIGERNQVYIDGGIYLMNLLYSLHYYSIAACPANWGKCVKDDRKIRNYIDIPMQEQIICIIVIGFSEENLSYANSERRSIDQVLEVF